MVSTQLSLTVPENVFKESKDESKRLGYRSVQEFILDTIRDRLQSERRYRLIESQLKKGNGKRMTQEEAIEFFRRF